MPAPTAEKFLESWYEAQCNGAWEHANGVTIESLASAGWLVTIDLQETPLEAHPMREVSSQRSDKDWMICKVEHNQFRGEGDPKKLSAILQVFETWASRAATVK